MRTLRSLLIFHQRLILPSLAVSIAIGTLDWLITSDFSIEIVGVSYILTSLLFHYFIYEIRNLKEYYFYFNLGISRTMLWLSTFAISALIVFIITIIA